MDCMDCHNRPTHIFTPPDRAIDLALNNGSIKRDLPWIKKTAAEALMAGYPDQATANKQIRDRIFSFYAKDYPAVYASRAADIEDAVAIATGIYNRSVFPKMKVDWTTYPDHIGHRNWPGCFRCHDGRHATADGNILTRSCTACHTMPQRGPLESLGALPPVSEEAWHPFALKGKHATTMCNRCHAPGVRPSADCTTCHKLDAKAPMMSGGCETCHAKEQEIKPINDCQTCHETLPGLHTKGGHPDASCTTATSNTPGRPPGATHAWPATTTRRITTRTAATAPRATSSRSRAPRAPGRRPGRWPPTGREADPVSRPRSRGPWTRTERAVLDRLTDPARIQGFLDTLSYSADPIYRCPRRRAARSQGPLLRRSPVRGGGASSPGPPSPPG